MPRQSLIQLRRGTTAQWSSANPVLDSGEMGYDLDLNELKVGDGSTAWSSLTALSGGGGSSGYYSFVPQPSSASEQEDGDYAGLDMASVPTNFLTSNGNWFVAIRLSRPVVRSTTLTSLVDGGAEDLGIGWATDGSRFGRNSSSGNVALTDVGTPARSNQWVIFQWDNDNTAYDAWVDGVRELDQDAPGFSPAASTPSNVSFLRTLTAGNFFYNLIGSASAIVIGNGNKLTNAEAVSITGSMITYADLPAGVQAKVTNGWSFDGAGPVTDTGAIDLTIGLGTAGEYEMVKDLYEADLATIADGAVTVLTTDSTTFDLSTLVSNRHGRTLTYSKLTGDAFIGTPNSSTGLISSINGVGQTEDDYTATYRITDGDGNTEDMTLTVTVTAPMFSEDWESGLNSWTQVDDQSTITEGDVVLTGMTDTNYNQTYTLSGTLFGQLDWISDQFDTTDATYKVYHYDAGGGTWYYVINKNAGGWVAISSTVDPATVSNGTDLLPSGEESITGFSDTEGSYNIPYDADANVDYTGGTSTAENAWRVGTATANGGTQSAYVSDDEGTSNNYLTTSANVTHIYKDFTTAGDYAGTATMEFAWKCAGESAFDYLRVYIAPVATTPTAATEVSTAYNVAGGTNRYSDAGGSWTSESIDVSSLVTTASTTYRVILSWKNDSSGGTQPPAAVDDIVIFES